MDDVRGGFLRQPHATTPATVIANTNIKVNSFDSSQNSPKKENGPYCTISDNNIIELFYLDYHQFSIKSYVVDVC